MENPSEIVRMIVKVLFSFIILFGFYVIVNGHITPGGGFQGGAVLGFITIATYMVNGRNLSTDYLHLTEKVLFFLILLLPVLLLFTGVLPAILGEAYLVAMNVIIGWKVFCGMSILFIHFYKRENL